MKSILSILIVFGLSASLYSQQSLKPAFFENNSYYFIYSKIRGNILLVKDANKAVLEYNFTGSDKEQWKMIQSGDNCFFIENKETKNVITWNENTKKLELSKNIQSDNQKWQIGEIDKDCFSISLKKSLKSWKDTGYEIEMCPFDKESKDMAWFIIKSDVDKYYNTIINTVSDTYAVDAKAWSFYDLKKYPYSLELFKKGIALKPDGWMNYYGAGINLIELQQPKDAIGYFEKSIACKNDEPWVYQNMALAYGQLKMPEKAVECYDRAISLYKNKNETPPEWIFHDYIYKLIDLKIFDQTAIIEYAKKLYPKSDSLLMAEYWYGYALAFDLQEKNEYGKMYEAWFKLYNSVKEKNLIWSQDISFSLLTIFNIKNTMSEFLCDYYKKFDPQQKELAYHNLEIFKKYVPKEIDFLYYALDGYVLYRDNKIKEAEDASDTAYNQLVKSMGSSYASPQYIDFPLKGIYQAGNSESGDSITHMGLDRFCYDIYGSDGEGNLYQDDGKKNEDFYGFGAAIYSPVDGEVAGIHDGETDQPPSGSPQGHGNYLDIKANNTYYHFVHLKKDSITVKMGDQVKKGQLIAKLGNSGSSIPHLHFGVYTPYYLVSLPVYFQNYSIIVNGQKVSVEKGKPGGKGGMQVIFNP